MQNVRDLCTSRPSAALRWTTRLEPLDQWEVVGDYYAPAKPPVRSSMDVDAADAALAVTKAGPVDSTESGAAAAGPSASDSAAAVPTAAQASSASTATPLGAAGTTGQRTADAAPLLRISAYTAERLFQVLADVAAHAEHGATILPRLRDLGVVEAVLDVIEVQRRCGHSPCRPGVRSADAPRGVESRRGGGAQTSTVTSVADAAVLALHSMFAHDSSELRGQTGESAVHQSFLVERDMPLTRQCMGHRTLWATPAAAMPWDRVLSAFGASVASRNRSARRPRKPRERSWTTNQRPLRMSLAESPAARDYFMTLLEMACTEPVQPLFPSSGDGPSERFVLSADVALYIDEVLHPR